MQFYIKTSSCSSNQLLASRQLGFFTILSVVGLFVSADLVFTKKLPDLSLRQYYEYPTLFLPCFCLHGMLLLLNIYFTDNIIIDQRAAFILLFVVYIFHKHESGPLHEIVNQPELFRED